MLVISKLVMPRATMVNANSLHLVSYINSFLIKNKCLGGMNILWSHSFQNFFFQNGVTSFQLQKLVTGMYYCLSGTFLCWFCLEYSDIGC